MKKTIPLKRKPNKKVILFSTIALAFVLMSFFVHWAFIIGAIILISLNQKELFKKRE